MANKKEVSLDNFAKRLKKLMEENDVTTRTLAEHVSLSHSTISRYMRAEMAPKVPTIESIAKYFNVNPTWLLGYDVPKIAKHDISGVIKIPVLGHIAAGQPLLSEENIIEYKEAPAAKVGNDQHFYLKVTGDSMINAGIKEGDYALVRYQEEVEHKDIAVVMVNNHEATLKRVFKNNGTVILQPENPNYDPIIVKNEEARIVGKLVGISREY